ncbi:hypothetical protein D3Z45_04165 [Lachnospiraceae bacterium]|nr:hypothetical protein [Lachnospiraceae bacterium]
MHKITQKKPIHNAGFLFTSLLSRLEDTAKKEKLKTKIIKIYTDSNSIIHVINYAKKYFTGTYI